MAPQPDLSMPHRVESAQINKVTAEAAALTRRWGTAGNSLDKHFRTAQPQQVFPLPLDPADLFHLMFGASIPGLGEIGHR